MSTPASAWRFASLSTTACAPAPRPAVMIVTDAPTTLATSIARSTALAAVFDPSVPTRILSNTRENLARSLRGLLGRACFGELDGRWFDAFDGTEDDLVVLRVHDDREAGAELLPQDPLRERVLDHALDGAPQRTGAERRVVALG